MPSKPSAENKITTASKSPMESAKEDDSLKNSAAETSPEAKICGKMSTQKASHNNVQKNSTNTIKVQLPPLRDIKAETGVSQGSMPEEHKGAYSTAAAAAELSRNAEDGYSWRKYGQKHVKGSEYPRSYYKCNNSSCPVKKKVERSHDGEITEIIYKGAHNHPKPHPRINLAGAPSTSCEMMDTSDLGNEPSNSIKLESGTGWKYSNNQLIRGRDVSRVGSSDWRPPDGLERTSSTSVLTEMLDPLMGAVQGNKSASLLGSAVDTTELTSSRIASLDYGEDEDGTTQGSTSQGDEADADESEPKRRKKEAYSTETYLPSRSNREPRVIVQIESEIDVLDDGYRWRKYGQKVVKGNPNPRSYYKCTSAGCPVRKHVERASDDIKSVLTTYEGKHNHEVPTTKTGTGLPTGTFNSPPDQAASNQNTALSVSRNPNAPNREMKVQDLPPLHYEMKPALGGDFLRPNLLGDLVSDMQIRPSSIYPLKFPPTPPLPSNMPYGSYMMNSNGVESCQKFPPVMLDFPMSIPMNVPRPSPNMALNNNFHPYNNHNHAVQNSTLLQSSSIEDQHIKESAGDPRFRRPKEEKRDYCSVSETCLQTNPDTNSNITSSTGFCRAMGNFPSQ
ncbi:OLC1v1025774C1 [Oldenlandia corymbosa var. corymbosa]|nr:OLC1v1025774C1 [Oldenlandia corymbosa var. corymbosa]